MVVTMSFGLKNVPATFQRLIHNTLRKYLNDSVITYLDNILIYSDDLEMHCSHVRQVLKKLKEKAVHMKKPKSKFEMKKIKFPEYII